MPAKSSKTSKGPTNPPDESAGVGEALDKFQPVRSAVLRWIVVIAPWPLILYSFFSVRTDPMFATGAWTVAIALFLFQFLMGQIADTFRTLWDRGVISGTPGESGADRAAKFQDFIKSFERLLNGRGQAIAALVLGVLAGGWVLFGGIITKVRNGESFGQAVAEVFRFLQTNILSFVLAERFWLYFLFGAILGLLVWRMLATSYEIRQLGKQFNLAPQFGHPDACAGFAPLGSLCLWNALIASAAAIYLGAWIIVLSSNLATQLKVPSWYQPNVFLTLIDRYGDTYATLFSFYLLVPLAYALLSFFIPIWNVHEIMLAKREVILQKLGQLGHSIDRLSREMLEQAESRSPEENQEAAKKLELMRQTYEANKRVPAWPFNTQIWVRFASSLAVPVLSLTNIAQPVVNAIGALLKAVNPGQ